ncbi:MAG TPA: cyclic nucleotide-binding domain-containing protein, partial [Chitinophagaceae bacterium]
MTDDMKYIYLRNHPLMTSLTEQKLRDAATMAKMKTVYRGEVISYGEGGFTRIHFLVKGKVKITDNSAAESELIKDILVEPDIFGDLSLDGQLNTFEAAEALTANTIIV